MSQSSRTSYHTHSRYCDGHGEIAEVIEEAIAAGLEAVGISSHAPLPFSTEWNMPLERLAGYVAEVRGLQTRYADQIRVLLGSEIDYIPGDEVAEFQRREVHPLGFDYYVGSVHFLGSGSPPRSFDGTEADFRAILRDGYGDDISRMVADYYRRLPGVLTIPGVRVVGHFDVIKRWNAGQKYFRGDEPWYLDAVEGALQPIAASGQIVELNTAGWRKGLGEPYPSPAILARCRELGIPITVNSDSHTPAEVAAGFRQAAELLAGLGIEPVSL